MIKRERLTMKTKWIWLGTLGLMVTLTLTAIADRPYVVMQDGRRVEGSAIRARRNGDVILTTERGDLEFARNQYREAVAARPQLLDQAQRALQAGQYDRVVSELERIVTEYRFLRWDLEALALIGRAQLGKEDPDAALATYNRLFQLNEAWRDNPAVRWDYYRAMLGAGQLDQLERRLDAIVRDDERSEAARAQVMRGDIKRERGRPEDALMDYLRTAVLFEAQGAARAEALYKAGTILEELRDARARNMFRKVVNDHGDSPYARRAQERL